MLIKGLKYLLITILVIPFIPVALVLLWIYGTFKLMKYLWSEKSKYASINEYFKNFKNLGASLLTVMSLVIVPTFLFNFGKDFIETEKIRQAEQAEMDQEEEQQFLDKKYKTERERVLSPEYRITKEIDKAESVDDTCYLTEEEIRKYDISQEEIEKFQQDRELAIIAYKDKKFVQGLEKKAKEYVSDNTTSSVYKHFFNRTTDDYGFNEDKTVVTISGRYTGRTLQLVNIRGRYDIKFDGTTGEIIEANLGKESVDSAKHPRN